MIEAGKKYLKRNQAYSLIELVFASFILLIGFTFVATIFQQSLAHQATVEENYQASNFAQNVLADLREQASVYDFYRTDDWSSFDSRTDSLAPGFEAKVTVESSNLSTPCRDFEERWPLSERQIMTDTMKTATIEVFKDSKKIFSIAASLPAPEATVRPTDPVVVDPIGGVVSSLSRDDEKEFSAKLFDSNGEEIPDVEFSFQVNPVDGNASISSTKRAQQAGTLKNVYLRSNGTRIYTGGKVKVTATAIYFGAQYRGESEEVTLLR